VKPRAAQAQDFSSIAAPSQQSSESRQAKRSYQATNRPRSGEQVMAQRRLLPFARRTACARSPARPQPKLPTISRSMRHSSAREAKISLLTTMWSDVTPPWFRELRLAESQSSDRGNAVCDRGEASCGHNTVTRSAARRNRPHARLLHSQLKIPRVASPAVDVITQLRRSSSPPRAQVGSRAFMLALAFAAEHR